MVMCGRGWSCVWDISRVRGLDGQEVGHVCGHI